MAQDFVELGAPARRRAWALKPAMLAIIRELGPLDHIAALHHLKEQRRVRPGVRLDEARIACALLEREGLLERDGAWKWRVPSDSAVIIPDREHDDGQAAACAA